MSSSPSSSPAPLSRPFLVSQRPAQPGPRSPLVLWHLLSLDAPTVAAVWTVFIARTAGVRISPLDPLAMFAAVWMLYAADRLLDAKPLFTSPAAAHLEERHRFHHRHRNRFLPAILAACLPLLILLHKTADAVLHLYVLLASLLGAWLLLVHARSAPSAQQHRLPKELAVGLFFPAAVFIPTVARAPTLRLALLPQALCFAAVCTLNCLFLYAWEHPLRHDHAHRTTQWSVRYLRPLAVTLTVLTGLLSLWAATHAGSAGHLATMPLPHPAAAPLACTLSGALLLLLNARQRRLDPLHLRALADLALLTPIPLSLATLLLRHP